jgi:hypothetical protein
MACEYYINGQWVSESTLKSVLNNGLLDNLIDKNIIDLEGFKIEKDYIVTEDQIEKRRDTIPAKKLADILSKEISTRQGYPLNMLSALELDETQTRFKIPLWASPYADKFENLLTSLVNNKVVKQKFPGHSYVLGSQEGFKVKEGEEANADLAKSGIVFSKNFDPVKGLQPMRYDPSTKKILPAQIMIPFKFRNEQGEILNIEEFTIEDESGRKIINTDKIPEKVLKLFGFRIPTQERNSMSAIEIVGFLPEASGDLVLAPRDFTKQMGSDFDVDKLYTYMYNTFYKDGKLYTNFLSNPDSIKKTINKVKKKISKIRKELELSREEDSLLNDYINQKLDYIDEGEVPTEFTSKASEFLSKIISTSYQEETQELLKSLDEAYEELSILNRSYKASRQNNILDIHLKVMTSNNPEVVSSIMALDSFGEFEDLSKEIYKTRLDRGLIPQTSTILSETYQRTKFVNATAGKSGVGVFSLDSTFNASAQGKDLIYLDLNEDSRLEMRDNPLISNRRILEINNVIASFGNIVSKGDMSNKYTLRSQQIINKARAEKRSLTQEEKDSIKLKSTIIRSLQSSAVDNEKAQILDKLNINDETFDTIRALTILGFEEEDIVGLLTQEIIWEYIEELKNAQSSLTDYNPNASQDIVNKLREKYDGANRYSELEPNEIKEFASISSKELLDNIKNKKLLPSDKDSETSDFNIQQLALLDKFLELQVVGETIQQVQSAINTESKGIPKSLLEVQGKAKQLSSLPDSIYGVRKLLGKIEKKKFIPTTINGYAAEYGLKTANTIFSDYFPYKTSGFQTIVDEVSSYIENQELSPSQQIALSNDVLDAIKSYLYSNPDTGLYTEQADLERRRLFVDTDTNNSLASILSSLSQEPWFTQNGFLNKLTFDLNSNGSLSRIYFEAATGENFDERNIYLGFLYLLDKNFEIGTFNGQVYTTRMLAQELVAAAFLEGGNQGAKQYLKYVPVSYLKTLEFGNYLLSIDFDFKDVFGGIIINDENSYLYPSRFTRQFFQNNPERTKTIDTNTIQNFDRSKGNPLEFTLKKEAIADNLVYINDPFTLQQITTQTQFVSIYDNKENGKYALYEFDNTSRTYKKIPVLKGSYGFTQYNPLEDNITIDIQDPKYVQNEPNSEDDEITNNHRFKKVKDLKIKLGTKSKDEFFKLLINLNLSDDVSDYNRKLLDEFMKINLPEKFTIEIINKANEGKGSFNLVNNKLMINLYYFNDSSINELAETIIHELSHVFTTKAIFIYENSDRLDLLSDKQIEAIKQIENIQKQYIDYVTEQGNAAEIIAFYNHYHEWRYSVGQVTKEKLDELIAKGPNFVEKNYSSLPKVDRKEFIKKYYGAISLNEFVSMSLTSQGFQEELNKVRNKEGKSLWRLLTESLIRLLETLGLNINKDSLLYPAIQSSLDLIYSSVANNTINITFNRGLDSSSSFNLNEEEYQNYLKICGK